VSFLLDTNVCIAVMNHRPLSVRNRLNDVIQRGAALSVSVITVVELQFGVAKSRRLEANVAALADFLQPLHLLNFDSEDAEIAGNIRAELERRGIPIGPYDYLIAAQAVRHDLTLVTANVKEFARVVGLRWENWTA
jgi:tRNA(fMet)-specific endonuclease VapC